MRLPPFPFSEEAMVCQADVRRSGETRPWATGQADWEEKCLVDASGGDACACGLFSGHRQLVRCRLGLGLPELKRRNKGGDEGN